MFLCYTSDRKELQEQAGKPASDAEDAGEKRMDTVRFGKFIRDMRKEKGLTQKQLADRLYVSDKAVSKWENGACFPDIKVLDQLFRQLKIGRASCRERVSNCV